LVEGDCANLQGEIHADYVHCHGEGEWEHAGYGDVLGGEHGEAGAGEDVEGPCCYEEMEGGEGGLTLAEGWVGKDGFVAEDLDQGNGKLGILGNIKPEE